MTQALPIFIPIPVAYDQSSQTQSLSLWSEQKTINGQLAEQLQRIQTQLHSNSLFQQQVGEEFAKLRNEIKKYIEMEKIKDGVVDEHLRNAFLHINYLYTLYSQPLNTVSMDFLGHLSNVAAEAQQGATSTATTTHFQERPEYIDNSSNVVKHDGMLLQANEKDMMEEQEEEEEQQQQKQQKQQKQQTTHEQEQEETNVGSNTKKQRKPRSTQRLKPY
jgi:hypothetical protein